MDERLRLYARAIAWHWELWRNGDAGALGAIRRLLDTARLCYSPAEVRALAMVASGGLQEV